LESKMSFKKIQKNKIKYVGDVGDVVVNVDVDCCFGGDSMWFTYSVTVNLTSPLSNSFWRGA